MLSLRDDNAKDLDFLQLNRMLPLVSMASKGSSLDPFIFFCMVTYSGNNASFTTEMDFLTSSLLEKPSLSGNKKKKLRVLSLIFCTRHLFMHGETNMEFNSCIF